MLQSHFGGFKSQEVKDFLDDALKWMTKQGFTGVKERSHRGRAGTWVVKFWHNTPSELDPTKIVMVFRGWFVVNPTEVELLVERVPAKRLDENAVPDTAAIVNRKVVIPFSGLDSLKDFKEEIKRWM